MVASHLARPENRAWRFRPLSKSYLGGQNAAAYKIDATLLMEIVLATLLDNAASKIGRRTIFGVSFLRGPDLSYPKTPIPKACENRTPIAKEKELHLETAK